VFRKSMSSALIAAIGLSFVACSSNAGGVVPSSITAAAASNCGSVQLSSSSRQSDSVSRTTMAVNNGLPSDYNNSPNLYSVTSSQSNYDLGSSIIEYNNPGSGGIGGGGGGNKNNAVCAASNERSPMAFIPFMCMDWYQAVIPGVHNQQTDTYLGTTCEEMWVPSDFMGNAGYKGGTGACAAANVDNTNGGCTIAYTARACAGSKLIDQPATDDKNGAQSNRISGVYSISEQIGSANQPLGWEYTTYGGQEYFQFSELISINAGVVSVSMGQGAIIPFKGNMFQAIQGFANLLGTAPKNLPYPYNSITPTTTIRKAPC